MNALQGIEGRVEWSEIAAPSCGQGEIRIRVAAAGLNRADLLQKAGLYPPPPGASPALGLECAGVVSEVGAGSTWQVGDRVCALHAGASGVGSAGIQLCKAFGNPCWVSVGSAERLAYCESLGAAGGALRKQSLESLRDFAPFDVILDPVGARYAGLNLELLRRDGRWVIIGLMGGREAQLDLAQLLGKRIQLTGSTLRTRDAEFKAQLIAELGLKVWPLFSAGKLRAQLERTFPIGDAEAAFEALASNQVQGKVVLVVDPSLA
ncbi:NAD(P)H-quinone oxidoreductase [Pseudomonas aeruginosa]|nr:NAD(P)H-quinone oxidoreductase [Pseudomonas aeruginosa]